MRSKPKPVQREGAQKYPAIIMGLLDEGKAAEALKLAAGFPRLGDEKKAITQGWAALSRPDFYRSIGKDPDALVKEGVAALRRFFGDAVSARA